MTRWRCIRQWQKNLFCSGDLDGNSRSEASDRTAGAPEDSAKSQGDGSRGEFARPILLSLICACLVGLSILVGQMVVDTSILLPSLIPIAFVLIQAPASKEHY